MVALPLPDSIQEELRKLNLDDLKQVDDALNALEKYNDNEWVWGKFVPLLVPKLDDLRLNRLFRIMSSAPAYTRIDVLKVIPKSFVDPKWIATGVIEGIPEMALKLADAMVKKFPTPELKSALEVRMLQNNTAYVLKELLRIYESMGGNGNSARLHIVFKGLTSASLVDKIEAMKTLRSYLKSSNSNNVRHSYITCTIPREILLEWLLKFQLVELHLLHDHVHEQILIMSEDVLRLLGEENCLKTSHIDMLWSHVQSHHDEHVDAALNVLKRILRSLSSDLIDYLFGKLNRICFDDYDSDTISLLAAFSQTVLTTRLNNSKDTFQRVTNGEPCSLVESRHYGILCLWEYLFDFELDELSDLVRDILVKLMNGKATAPLKGSYISKCVLAIQQGQSVGHVIPILKACLKSSLSNQLLSSKESTSELALRIDVLEEKHGLLRAILDELQIFVVIPTGDDRDKERHASGLVSRIDFISFLASNSTSITIDQICIESIWTSCILNNVVEIERNRTLLWLSSLYHEFITNRQNTTCNPDALSWLFTERTQKFDPSHYTIEYFSHFRAGFLVANILAGKLSAFTVSTFDLLDDDLIGINLLWKLCIESGGDVRAEATRLLSYLYSKIIPGKDPCLMRYEFVARIARQFSIGISEGKVSILEATLEILEKIISSDENSKCLVYSHSANATKIISVAIKCIGECNQGESFKVEIDGNASVGELLRMIQSQIGFDLKLQCYVGKGKLKDDNSTLFTTGVVNNSEVVVSLLPSRKRVRIDPENCIEDEVPSSIGMELDAPSIDIAKRENLSVVRILSSNRDYFNLLFELLETQAISDKVWSLIISLPEEVSLREVLWSITDESTPQFSWSNVIECSNVFKLLYSLRIIEAMAFDSKDLNNRWLNAFIKFKGAEFLCIVLRSFSFSFPRNARGKAAVESLCILLRLLYSVTFNYLKYQGSLVFSIAPDLRAPVVDVYIDSSDDECFQSLALEGITVKLLELSLLSVDTALEDDVERGSLISLSTTFFTAIVVSRGIPEVFAETRAWRELITRGILSKSVAVIGAIFNFTHMLVFKIRSPVLIDRSNGAFYSLSQVLLQDFIDLINAGFPESNTHTVHAVFNLTSMLLKDEYAYHSNSMNHDNQTLDAARSLLIRFGQKLFQLRPSVVLFDDLQSGFTLLLSVLLECCPQLESDVSIICPDFIGRLLEEFSLGYEPCRTSSHSKQRYFELLRQLSRTSESHALTILDSLHRSLDAYRSPGDWKHLPEENVCESHVGIINPSCICYMNSSLQQLFMNPRFRSSMLSARVDSCADTDHESDGQPTPAGYFSQLQNLFANLLYSEAKAANPQMFCDAYTNIDGSPLDITEQMDVNEFLNILFDRLENTLKGSDHSDILEPFSGKLSNQIICQRCHSVSERIENFHAVEVDVKNRNQLVDGLDAFCEGETLSGDNAYFCGKCQSKQIALKRTCIKSLPSSLVLTLKRFGFNYENMSRTKLHNPVEFPMDLNMLPYTSQSQNPEVDTSAFQYELVGVIVHSGSATAGHYISYSRELLPDGSRGNWFEFNDEEVNEFDIADLPGKCFGYRRFCSAYLLFYDKVERSGQMVVKGLEIPHQIFSAIDEENARLRQARFMLDPNFNQFLVNFLDTQRRVEQAYPDDKPDSYATLPFWCAFNYTFNVLERSLDDELFSFWVKNTTVHLDSNTHACLELLKCLSESNGIFVQYIFASRACTRRGFVDVVFRAILVLHPFEQPLDSRRFPSSISIFMIFASSLIPDSCNYSDRFSEFYSLLARFGHLGYSARFLLWDSNVLEDTVDMIISSKLVTGADFQGAFELLAVIILGGRITSYGPPSPFQLPGDVYDMDDLSFMEKEMYLRALSRQGDTKSMEKALCHVSFNCKQATLMASDVISQILIVHNISLWDNALDCLYSLIELKDGLVKFRVDSCMRGLIDAISKNTAYRSEYNRGISFLLKIIGDFPAVGLWMSSNRDVWDWIDPVGLEQLTQST